MSFRKAFKRVKGQKEASGAETGAIDPNVSTNTPERKPPSAPTRKSRSTPKPGLTFLKEDATDHEP